MTSPDPAAAAGRRADQFLTLLTTDDAAAGACWRASRRSATSSSSARDCTAVARSEARALPPAQRAQANTRQLRLGELRDAHRSDPAGLRTWLRQAGEEILLIRSQRVVADRVVAADQEWTAARAAAEASGTAAASSAPTTT